MNFRTLNMTTEATSLYENQLDREDLKENLKNVVKWKYVNDKCLIVTCRWSTKILNRLSEYSVTWENPIISRMFSAGTNSELKWEMEVEVTSENRLYITIRLFDLNSIEYDYSISLLKKNLELENFISFGSVSFRNEKTARWGTNFNDKHLCEGRTVISFIVGFVADVSKCQQAKPEIKSSFVPIPQENLDESMTGNGLDKLLDNPLFSDVTFVIGEEKMQAHKCILATHSPVFYHVFANSNEKSNVQVIEIRDFHPDTLKEMLHFMYTGNYRDYGEESARQMLIASSKYAVESLFTKTQKVLLDHLSISNAVEFLKLANLYQANDLKNRSIEKIAYNMDCIDGSQLSSLEPELLTLVFSAVSKLVSDLKGLQGASSNKSMKLE